MSKVSTGKKLDFSAVDLRKLDLVRKYDDDFAAEDGISLANHLLLITIGVVMPAVLPNMLKSPPLKPAICFGDVSDTTAQPSDPTPLPKNARAIRLTTTDDEST